MQTPASVIPAAEPLLFVDLVLYSVSISKKEIGTHNYTTTDLYINWLAHKKHLNFITEIKKYDPNEEKLYSRPTGNLDE